MDRLVADDVITAFVAVYRSVIGADDASAGSDPESAAVAAWDESTRLSPVDSEPPWLDALCASRAELNWGALPIALYAHYSWRDATLATIRLVGPANPSLREGARAWADSGMWFVGYDYDDAGYYVATIAAGEKGAIYWLPNGSQPHDGCSADRSTLVGPLASSLTDLLHVETKLLAQPERSPDVKRAAFADDPVMRDAYDSWWCHQG